MQPFEAPDRLPALPGLEMRAHELASRLLVGGILIGQPIPPCAGPQ